MKALILSAAIIAIFVVPVFAQQVEDKPKSKEISIQAGPQIVYSGLANYMGFERIAPGSFGESESYVRKAKNILLNLCFLHKKNDHLYLGIKAGIGFRNINETSKHTVLDYSSYPNPLVSLNTVTVRCNQKIYHINPVVEYAEEIGKLRLSFGCGASVIIFGKTDFSLNEFKRYNGSGYLASFSTNSVIDGKIGGGKGFGGNCYIALNYNVKKFFSIGLSVEEFVHYLIFDRDDNFTTFGYTVAGSGGSYFTVNDFKQISFSELHPSINFGFHF